MDELQKPTPKLGMDVFYRDKLHGEIQVAKITNDAPCQSEAGKDTRPVNLVVFKDSTGYVEAVTKIPCGLGKGQWWHSLEEMKAQCIAESKLRKLTG